MSEQEERAAMKAALWEEAKAKLWALSKLQAKCVNEYDGAGERSRRLTGVITRFVLRIEERGFQE